MEPVRDRLGRPALDLRISVTDRCNLRCPYCMPREVFGRDFQFIERTELLTFEEIARVTSIMSELGVAKVRLTGGEPLLRRGIERLVEMINGVEGIDDVALTTNGTLLARRCEALATAGLGRVTVSLDALDEAVFRSMSDSRVPLARVLAGIDAAQDAGLGPLKVNMVVRRGVNDHCVLAMAEHFRSRPQVLRFIEYMDVGETNGWKLDEVVPGSEILAAIDDRWALEPLSPTTPGEVASRWAYKDGAGEIGVIQSVTKPFCQGCTRARLSADGRLYTCLFASEGYDLRSQLRGGASDAEISSRLREIWTSRADRYSELRGLPQPPTVDTPAAVTRAIHKRGRKKVEMSYIGG
jgi:cyclic pyranopterin phosphate synthase